MAAGLVAEPRQWPGLISLPVNLERHTFSARRPSSLQQDLPPRAGLKLTRPPCLRRLRRDAYRRLIAEKTRERLEEICEQRVLEGRSGYLGRDAILRQDPECRPAEPETRPRRAPTVACADRAVRKQILKGLRRFHRDYREAWKVWKTGNRKATFPPGTYLMAALHKARCSKGSSYFSLE